MNNGLSDLWSAMAAQEPFAVAVMFLALVFSVSGISKLRRPELAALAISDFGVTDKARPRAGFLLGAGELLLAAALIISAAIGDPLRAVPVLVAAVLLATFSVLIWRSLRSQESFACYCFGDTEETISALTLLRTIGLTALAVLLTISALVAGGDSSAVSFSALVMEMVAASAILGTLVLITRVRVVMEVPHVCD